MNNVDTKNQHHVRIQLLFIKYRSDTLIAFENIEITTRSHPDAFPSALHQKRKTQTKFQESDEALLTVSIPEASARAWLLTTKLPRQKFGAKPVGTMRRPSWKDRHVATNSK